MERSKDEEDEDEEDDEKKGQSKTSKGKEKSENDDDDDSDGNKCNKNKYKKQNENDDGDEDDDINRNKNKNKRDIQKKKRLKHKSKSGEKSMVGSKVQHHTEMPNIPSPCVSISDSDDASDHHKLTKVDENKENIIESKQIKSSSCKDKQKLKKYSRSRPNSLINETTSSNASINLYTPASSRNTRMIHSIPIPSSSQYAITEYPPDKNKNKNRNRNRNRNRNKNIQKKQDRNVSYSENEISFFEGMYSSFF